ncbi:MAG: hypothetical protein GWN00_13440 [Aliifodinibius sp.]|nr:hypothetical protein [Fodinibius sp.]NIW42139.1 hypothetical protein [candidate division Zixibacteria bacterium]NIY25771.1 hypothetical protein [Fodinibius sp.]
MIASARNEQPRFLVENYVISYIPSASVLKYCQEKNTGKRDRLLLLTATAPPVPGA